MFRNNYDNDAITFSPQGRIFQIEYAAEAVKQGSVVVGVVSKTHVVLAAIKRNAEELSSYQKKLFQVDDHVGVAIAGLTSDARVLSNFMKTESMSYKLYYGRIMPLSLLAERLGGKAQTHTQWYGYRPYGVGLLIAGVDDNGPHLYEFQPSGLVEEMSAFAIGARSQMARTYLERHINEFADCSREHLVKHALAALRESLVQDKQLTVDNTSIAIVGRGESAGEGSKPALETFRVYDDEDVLQWISSVQQEEEEGGEAPPPPPPAPAPASAPAPAGGEGMEVDS